jgi:hypothetical protein
MARPSAAVEKQPEGAIDFIRIKDFCPKTAGKTIEKPYFG